MHAAVRDSGFRQDKLDDVTEVFALTIPVPTGVQYSRDGDTATRWSNRSHYGHDHQNNGCAYRVTMPDG